MTAGEFREVDHDLLADHVGGALVGTPEGATVERLIAQDPAWQQAHADLVRAFEAVSADLAGWGADPEPMPAEVTDRLMVALAAATAAEGPAATAAEGPAATAAEGPAEQPTDDPAPNGGAAGGGRPGRRLRAVPDPHAVPDQSRPSGARNAGTPGPGSRGPGSTPARRRWSRLAGPVAVAAAVVAFAGFGVSRLVVPESGQDSSTAARQESDTTQDGAGSASGDAPRALLDQSPQRLLATGTDYQPATLAAAAGFLSLEPTDQAETRAAPDAAPNAEEGGQGDAARARLGRLTDRTALAGCLDAVAAEHGQGPLTVEAVDYATFETAPALIVVFTDPTGGRWAMAVDPTCGLPGYGAAPRYVTQVG